MPRLIFKCPYIKSGKNKSSAHISNYIEYISTREGVERLSLERGSDPSTPKQKDMVEKIIKDFPLSRSMKEYENYKHLPNSKNASNFISKALENNIDEAAKKENYIDYIANRPRVQKIGSHGLFTDTDDPLMLSHISNEVANHSGNVWLPIISLRREDASRLGYDNAESWKALLSSQAMDIAEAMKIPWENFRWYAAFHDEGNHPHVHMVCYSTDPSKGYLTKKGIDNIKSGLAKQIFCQELTEIYRKQTHRRNELTSEISTLMDSLIDQMQNESLENSHIEKLLSYLSNRLKSLSGKKQYGYLKAELKNVVDEIVNELEKDPRVTKAYSLWYEQRENVLLTYKDDLPPRLPLSKQKEFKSIKNLIIKEAVLLSEISSTKLEHSASKTKLTNGVTNLLRHLGNIFKEQFPGPTPKGIHIKVDHKLQRKIQEKKAALGVKQEM